MSPKLPSTPEHGLPNPDVICARFLGFNTTSTPDAPADENAGANMCEKRLLDSRDDGGYKNH